MLSYLGIGSIAVGSGLIGYLAGSGKSEDSIPGIPPISAEDRKEIADLRAEAQFRREYDGRVWVLTQSGEWWEVRSDPQVAGTLLMRDPQGYVHSITLGLQQIDLTDDYVVVALFGDGSWQQQAQRVQAKNDDGEIVDAQLTQEAFRDLISLIV